MLFVSRFQIRKKEFAVRAINGASNASLLKMLAVEISLTLVCATLIGSLLMEWLTPTFKRLSGVNADSESIYGEMLFYGLALIGCSLLVSLIPIHFFRKQSLQQRIKGHSPRRRDLFRKITVTAQLTVSMALIFCCVVLFKQIALLQNAERNIEIRNIASLRAFGPDMHVVAHEIRQLPTITEAHPALVGMLPRNTIHMVDIKEWDGKSPSQQPVSAECIFMTTLDYLSFYKLQFLNGRNFSEKGHPSQEIVLNQTAARSFGWDDPVGKKVKVHDLVCTVIGLVRDFYVESPTMPLKPTLFNYQDQYRSDEVIYKYKSGTWAQTEQQVRRLMKEKFPSADFSLFHNMEEEAARYIQSEKTLLSLLSAVSIVCIIISISGIYSLAALTCERRRKEIAIRKVNGATTGSIIRRFFGEYMALTGLAAVIAFVTGYRIMQPWTQQYLHRATIGPDLFLLILGAVILCIAGTVSQLIWKAANKNPAQVVKSE